MDFDNVETVWQMRSLGVIGAVVIVKDGWHWHVKGLVFPERNSKESDLMHYPYGRSLTRWGARWKAKRSAERIRDHLATGGVYV